MYLISVMLAVMEAFNLTLMVYSYKTAFEFLNLSRHRALKSNAAGSSFQPCVSADLNVFLCFFI